MPPAPPPAAIEAHVRPVRPVLVITEGTSLVTFLADQLRPAALAMALCLGLLIAIGLACPTPG